MTAKDRLRELAAELSEQEAEAALHFLADERREDDADVSNATLDHAQDASRGPMKPTERVAEVLLAGVLWVVLSWTFWHLA